MKTNIIIKIVYFSSSIKASWTTFFALVLLLVFNINIATHKNAMKHFFLIRLLRRRWRRPNLEVTELDKFLFNASRMVKEKQRVQKGQALECLQVFLCNLYRVIHTTFDTIDQSFFISESQNDTRSLYWKTPKSYLQAKHWTSRNFIFGQGSAGVEFYPKLFLCFRLKEFHKNYTPAWPFAKTLPSQLSKTICF